MNRVRFFLKYRKFRITITCFKHRSNKNFYVYIATDRPNRMCGQMWSLSTKPVILIFFAFPTWKELLISTISIHLSAHYATYPNLLQPCWGHSTVDRPSLFKPSARPATSVKKRTAQFGGSMATPGELNEKKTNSNVSHQHFLLFLCSFCTRDRRI